LVAASLIVVPTLLNKLCFFTPPSDDNSGSFKLVLVDIYIPINSQVLANERRMISIKENIFLYRKLFFFTKSFQCPCPFLKFKIDLFFPVARVENIFPTEGARDHGVLGQGIDGGLDLQEALEAERVDRVGEGGIVGVNVA
jgi:hypothetical protein